ncbi:unnamed protein product [Caenorhabditis nigoni]|uniref:Uncharacterized protein n=1 Tax=Caenorhabditis nigoni TaxID=1611254 RepID=A0A2G5VUT8_9PELO|nr:hypothetical protein B9Z55_000729 [Caenorhabditis nigoni]
MAYGPARTNLRLMFSWVCSHPFTKIADVLPLWKIAALNKITEPCLNEDEMYHLFLGYYRSNMFFATCDMFAGYASSFMLPTRFFPTMIVIDESTMVQPSDLTTFTSKMRRKEVPVEIRYFLFGLMKQLEPFNTIRTLAPILKSPNQLQSLPIASGTSQNFVYCILFGTVDTRKIPRRRLHSIPPTG